MSEHNPAYPDTNNTIAVDLDGVIHDNCKGYHDGTCYGDLIEGARPALEMLSNEYRVIIYTTKARSDRPLVNGKTGKELVWEWLNKKGLSDYITDVTAEKPPAKFYIDDKAVRFGNWLATLQIVMGG